MENIIGFCADTCNVMFGIHHSVAQMLVANYPWIIPIKCSCHMIHLCVSHASLQLHIFTYLHYEQRIVRNFKSSLILKNISFWMLDKPGGCQWRCALTGLSNNMKLYFTGAALEDPTHTNDNILKSLNNKFTLAYLQFMAFNPGRFVSFNTLFQIPKWNSCPLPAEKLIKNSADLDCTY